MLRRFRLLRRAAAGFVVASAVSGAAAQDGVDTFGPFHLVANAPGVVALEGPILFGTGTEFIRAMLATPEPPSKLLLNSDGGSVEEAFLIADAVRLMRIETEIPEGSTCQSACVLIFFAGVGRTAVGTLGVHRFSTTQEGFEPFDDPATIATSRELLLRFGASPELVDLAFEVPFAEMRILSPEEIVAFAVNRTREEGLRLAEAEDYPAIDFDDEDATLDAMEVVGTYMPGVTMTIRRAGMADETHVGATLWEVGERQGTLLVSIAIPDIELTYRLLLGPFTDERFPYLYGGFYVTLVGPDGLVPMNIFASLALGNDTGQATDPLRLLRLGFVAIERSDFGVLGAFPRLMLDSILGRLEQVKTMQLAFSIDGTADNVLFVDFDVTEAGRDAISRALPAWERP